MLICPYVCLFVFAINVKTIEPIGPKLCVGPQVTPGNLWMINISNIGVHKFFFNFEKSTYILCLSVCPYGSNKRKVAEPIGPKFCVGPHMTPGKVYRWSYFQKGDINKIRYEGILKNVQIFLIKSAKIFKVCFYNVYNEKMFTV